MQDIREIKHHLKSRASNTRTLQMNSIRIYNNAACYPRLLISAKKRQVGLAGKDILLLWVQFWVLNNIFA